MDFLDEDCRPRFVFQSKQLQSSSSSSIDQQSQLLQDQKPSKLFLFITITISSILLITSTLYLQSELYQSLLLWVSLSLLIGPFAPSNITGGSARVGHGKTLEEIDEPISDDEKNYQEPKRKSAYKRVNSNPVIVRSDLTESARVSDSNRERLSETDCGGGVMKEMEWSDEDFEMLKKQLAKNPVGKPGRWEVIGEAFRGRHKVENVIKKAKELSERKSSDGKTDDYALFLKNRKPLDSKKESAIENVDEIKNGDVVGWSSGEDIGLLNALKVFTKDVPMRWEKIAAAVPGKSKTACMKRVTELKKEFRSSKANANDT